jgi:hypothetical protein
VRFFRGKGGKAIMVAVTLFVGFGLIASTLDFSFLTQTP